jgi:hypothetical protein
MPSKFPANECVVDRRTGADRRKKAASAGGSAGEPAAGQAAEHAEHPVERRAKVERRRQIDPTTCERDYSEEEVEFMKAMDDYKRRSGRQFPTWSEVLEVLRSIGYRKVAEPTELVMK